VQPAALGHMESPGEGGTGGTAAAVPAAIASQLPAASGTPTSRVEVDHRSIASLATVAIIAGAPVLMLAQMRVMAQRAALALEDRRRQRALNSVSGWSPQPMMER